MMSRSIAYGYALIVTVGFGSLAHVATAGTRPKHTLHVLTVVSFDTASRSTLSLRRGLALGAEEAARTLALFGDSLVMRVVVSRDAPSADSAERVALSDKMRPLAIIRGDGFRCLTPDASAPLVPIIDAVCEPGTPAAGTDVSGHDTRSAPFIPLRVRPGATGRAHIQLPYAMSHVELWHPSLERFGAEQLNQRYERRWGATMDSDAWAGWIAVKILTESALRAQATASAALLRALTDPKAQFDGHKGRPLRFSVDTRELLQPLYVVARDSSGVERVVSEVMPEP
jgi:hypothetical protein